MLKQNTIILSIIFCLVPKLSAQQMDDVVYLKDGSIIHGIIIEEIPNASIKIQTKDGNIFVYKTEDIMKITRETPTSAKTEVKTKEEESTTETIYKEGEKYPTGKGSTLIWGEISLTNTSGDLSHKTDISINSSYLDFLKKGLGFGIDAAFTSTSYEDGFTTTALVAGPKLAYFIGGPQSRLFPYFGTEILYINANLSYEGNSASSSGYAINFNGGICPLIGKNGCATIGLGYTFEHVTGDYYSGTSGILTFGIGLGIFKF